MKIWSWIVGSVLGLSGALAVIALLSRMWDACDVGLNSAASSWSLVFVYAPVVALSTLTSVVFIFWLAARYTDRLTKPGSFIASISVTLVIVWLALYIGHDPEGDYPSPWCVDNVPAWFPHWIPL